MFKYWIIMGQRVFNEFLKTTKCFETLLYSGEVQIIKFF
jgi:hypothetical protein